MIKANTWRGTCARIPRVGSEDSSGRYKNAGRSAFRSQFLKGAHFKGGEHSEHSPGAVLKTWSKARASSRTQGLRH